jgi:hypothetical protein
MELYYRMNTILDFLQYSSSTGKNYGISIGTEMRLKAFK